MHTETVSLAYKMKIDQTKGENDWKMSMLL